jgi:Flp pilus assembly protein TadG
MKREMIAEESGQALLEFSVLFIALCILVFGIIDFGRAIYDMEVMTNLVAEGSSMASRGTSPTATAQTVVTDAGADINIGAVGCVIVTAVTNVGPNAYNVTAQASQGGIACTSKIGCLQGQGTCTGSTATLPASATSVLSEESLGATIYTTEILYNYRAITPVPALLGTTMPSQLYAVAYY